MLENDQKMVRESGEEKYKIIHREFYEEEKNLTKKMREREIAVIITMASGSTTN